MIKKIVVLGPESTGKSTLCAGLAGHYNTTWVKEYAREYLLDNGAAYRFETLLDIAKGQCALEDKTIAGYSSQKNTGATSLVINNKNTFHHPSPVFIDTDMYVMKVWCEFVYGDCHRWILNQIVARRYDLYLLCDIDLPWVEDELREYPDMPTREKQYHHYKDMMLNQPVPWVNITGKDDTRLFKAIDAVDKILMGETVC